MSIETHARSRLSRFGRQMGTASLGRFIALAAILLSMALFGYQTQSHLSSSTATVAPASLFDPSAPLVKGQEVHANGVIQYQDPDEDLDADRASARLRVANGNFDILLDARGLEMTKAMDGRLVDVKAILTGEYSSDISMSVSFGLNGKISKASRVPEIKVVDFKYGSPQTGIVNTIVDNGDGTVSDKQTGLVWQKDDDGSKKPWNAALDYPKSLTLGGHSDWRLPTRDELTSLWQNAGRKKKLRNTVFASMKSSVYWSSTTQKGDPDWVEAVSFDPGEHVAAVWNRESHYVRCVRRGK